MTMIKITDDDSKWHSGSGAPAGGLGNDNDFYLNTDNGDVYKKSGGSWALQVNIQGADGSDGADGADGQGVPVGGSAGEVLAKASGTDYDTEWVAPSGGGGSGDRIEGTGTASTDGLDGAVYAIPLNVGATADGGSLLCDPTRYSAGEIGYKCIDLCFYPDATNNPLDSTDPYMTVIGGYQNIVGRQYGAIVGGDRNVNNGFACGIVGGSRNEITSGGQYSLLSGYFNSMEARYSFVSGSRCKVRADNSTSGGTDVDQAGQHSIAHGEEIQNIGSFCFIFGDYSYNFFSYRFILSHGPFSTGSIGTGRYPNHVLEFQYAKGRFIFGRHYDCDASQVSGDVNIIQLHTLNHMNQSNYVGYAAHASMTTSYVIREPQAIPSAGAYRRIASSGSGEAQCEWTLQLYSPHNDAGNSGTSLAIDWDNGNVQTVTLTDNTTLSFSSAKAGAAYTLIIKQDATGGRTITWPTMKWAGGTALTSPTSAANAIDIVTIVYDGTDFYAAYNQDFS